MAGTLEIVLPEPLRAFVEAQIASGAYDSASAFVEQLVREAQERETAQTTLEVLLLEGLDSGAGIEVATEYWIKKKAALQ